MRQRVHDGLGSVRTIDPALADQLEQVAMTRLNYLAQVAPKDPGIGSPGASRWQPAADDLARFARIAAVVENPLRLLDHLASDTLTPPVVHAVQNVYPEFFKQLGAELLDRLTQPGSKPLPEARRLGLAMITGMPVDSTQQAQFGASLQQLYQQVAAKKRGQQQGQRPRQSEARDVRTLRSTNPTPGQEMGS